MQTILYIEDDENDRHLFTTALQRGHGHATLRCVPDALKAQQYLMGTGAFSDRELYPFPDLLVLDYVMPLMNGDTFLQWLNESPYRDLPVVVVTGSQNGSETERLLDLGAREVIPKPFGMQDLTRLVEYLCEPSPP